MVRREQFILCPCTVTPNQGLGGKLKHKNSVGQNSVCGCKGAGTPEECLNLVVEEEEEDKKNGVPAKSPQLSIQTAADLDAEECHNKREEWSHPIEFLLSCISMSVGLGNVWRFPFVAYKNGGGAFLIPYIIVQVNSMVGFFTDPCGKTIIFPRAGYWTVFFIWSDKSLENGSAIQGRGLWIILCVGFVYFFSITICVMSYYCSVMATSIFYFFASFQSPLPWTVCNDQWTGVVCHHEINGTNATESLLKATEANIPELYYKREVLKEKERIEDGIGMPEWRLSLCLILFWTIIFFCMIKGIKSCGKIAYFTALYPYLVLIILLIKGLTLEGSLDGILYLITPQWHKLLEAKVWYAAIEQCFFSLSVGFGPVIMFASYNPFRHNIYRDSIILTSLDTLTSALAATVVFAILGFLAHETGLDITQVSRGGTALAFESYPLVISKFEWAQAFSALFFLMLLTLGVGSTISGVSSLSTVVHDRFPKLNKTSITAFFCTLGFFSGLIYVTPGGQWMLELVDYFGCGLVIVFTATLEVIGIVWVYGLGNIVRDIEFMLQRPIGAYWKICWSLVVPVGVSIILLGKLWTAGAPTHNDIEFPPIAIVCGGILCAMGLLVIPVCAVHAVYTRGSSGLFSKLVESIKPSWNWGPRDSELRQEWGKESQVPQNVSFVSSNLFLNSNKWRAKAKESFGYFLKTQDV